jgi:hypothetical protein
MALNMTRNSQLLLEIGQGLSLTVGLPTIASWNTDKRPRKAKRGTFGFNVETQSLEYWDGSAWFTVAMGEI